MKQIAYLIIKRIGSSLPLILGISFISFILINITPGNYFDSLKLNPQISQETIAQYEKLYHLDKPLPLQYLYWLKSLFHFNFGYSFSQKSPVLTVIKIHLVNTLILSLSCLVFTWLISLPLGIYCAVAKNKFSEKIISFLSFISLGCPPFFLSLLLLYTVSLSYNLNALSFLRNLIPLGGMKSLEFDSLPLWQQIIDISKHLIIPTLAISLSAIASLQRIMQGSLLEVLRKEYIKTAIAYGLSPHKVVYFYALKNAVNPLITLFGYQLSGILGGAALVEIICNWPGLGNIMLTAVSCRDIFLVMGGLIISAVLLLLGNLIADLLLLLVDPQITYAKHKN